MSQAERKKQDILIRRDDIITAFCELVREKGFDNTTMDDVATASDFTKKTLYRYFPAKEELLFEAGCKAFGLLIDEFEKALADGENGLEKIRMAGRAYYSYSVDNPGLFAALSFSRNTHGEAEKTSACHEEMLGLQQKMFAGFRAAIDAGKADGSIRTDHDSMKMAIFVVGMSISLVEAITASKEAYETFLGTKAEELIAFALDLLCDAIKNR